MATQKMVELEHVRRWEKGNRSNIYWRVVKLCVGSIHYGTNEIFCPLGTYFAISVIFWTNQVFMLNWFKYFKQNITQFLFKDVLICSDQNMTQVAKYVSRGQNVPILLYCILLTSLYLTQNQCHKLVSSEVFNMISKRWQRE